MLQHASWIIAYVSKWHMLSLQTRNPWFITCYKDPDSRRLLAFSLAVKQLASTNRAPSCANSCFGRKVFGFRTGLGLGVEGVSLSELKYAAGDLDLRRRVGVALCILRTCRTLGWKPEGISSTVFIPCKAKSTGSITYRERVRGR